MSNVSEISVGLAHEVFITATKAGFTPVELGDLAKNEKMMRQFREVLLGHATITVPKHVIDCDAKPFVPNGWRVQEHRKGGRFTWDAAKAKLYLSKKQQGSGYLLGYDLRNELKSKPVYNANVLDYLLANPHLIPKEWKDQHIFFWGTVYSSFSSSYIRSLCWDFGCCWRWECQGLDYPLDVNHPAAMSAS